MDHAVSRLRTQRLARSAKPFLARGGSSERCPGCRLVPSHCLCHLATQVPTQAGVCLVMGDIEALKPSNTGWLVADVVPHTHAFGWARTEVDPALLALLADPQWQPWLVFPAEYARPGRAVTHSPPLEATEPSEAGDRAEPGHTPLGNGLAAHGKRPLFVLLDGTWAEARKMFHKSPCLDALPVLSLRPTLASVYRLRRSKRGDHWCTAEVAAACLHLAGDALAAQVLLAHLAVFTQHYLSAKAQQPANRHSPEHLHLHSLLGSPRHTDSTPAGHSSAGQHHTQPFAPGHHQLVP